MMDISYAAQPNSDQVNAEDMLSGPRIVTVEKVTKGSAEQPVYIHLAEFPGRTYRPCKSMVRVLIAGWGKDASTYAGRRLMLYRDPDVRFGKDTPGGIRISAMSHIDSRLTLALTVTRGRRAPFTVDPLPDVPEPITAADADAIRDRIAKAETLDALESIAAELKALNLGAHRDNLQAAWRDRQAELKAAQ
ncbi:hypothetical protein OF855_24635 [Mycolicibacterium fortuitum]|uniref:hypothetical protein n=1 Tax=Mycolicibacterium fortuitum TaxID=1766 RepID=UPI0022BA6987|nr:hypothetical protein [Mycolicibacterium fortuitum]WAY18428.1 hypothetical protein OF855_24635 [Mycolicibacterium fortuitum]